ncbi:hypothetical protein QYM36_014215, partial [Artemia franciscana]
METPSPVDEAPFRSSRSLKIQAQRKFAQGYGPAAFFQTQLKNPSATEYPTTIQTPLKDVPDFDIDSLPSTEDFLDFLCYRETNLYKPKNDVFLKLKPLSSWDTPGSDDRTKDESDEAEDEPLIKLKHDKKVTNVFECLSSVSSSEESLASLKKDPPFEEEVKPKKRFPMLRPIAVGTPLIKNVKTKLQLQQAESETACRTLRSGKVTEVGEPSTLDPKSKTQLSKTVSLVQDLKQKKKVQLKTRTRSQPVEKTAISLSPLSEVEDKPLRTRANASRRMSEEIPLEILKRIKVDEVDGPVSCFRNTRSTTTTIEPAKTRRGSLSHPSTVKLGKAELSVKKNTAKKVRNKTRSSTYFERLKEDGFISGDSLNIYDNCTDFLPDDIIDAPVLKPTEEEFSNPFRYIEKISKKAEKFGICKIIPPTSFKSSCILNEDLRFVGYKQHVHKLFDRFGPNVKEYSAIRRHLLSQGIETSQLPIIAGLELDLPMLSAAVEANGGLNKIIEEKKWAAVSDFLRAPKWAQDRSARLDELYIKYLLAYDLLSPEERNRLYEEAEAAKDKRFKKRLSNEPIEEEDDPLQEKDECTIKGRSMSLKDFKRVAKNASAQLTYDSDTCETIEGRFWRLVETQLQHTCVLIGSVDAGDTGCGFPSSKSPLAKHPWNPKVLTNSSESVLRSMSRIIGVTAPILHFGMVFSACCWFRDPHGLPWIEFMHSGSPRVWYGLSVDQEPAFRSAVQKLWPGFIQNKRVWLPSDAVMISPRALHEKGIRLSRTVQNPGEFIVVFPRAFTNSISTGYSVSESAYFAPIAWLKTAPQIFADARESCEPTMFSLDRLLVSMVQDSKVSGEMLKE